MSIRDAILMLSIFHCENSQEVLKLVGLQDNPIGVAIAMPRNEKYVEYVQPALPPGARLVVDTDEDVDLGVFQSE